MSEAINLPGVAQEGCRCLRSKDMYIDAEPDLSVPSSRSGIFWCLHTQNCLGPDGQLADFESCKPGRTCYEQM